MSSSVGERNKEHLYPWKAFLFYLTSSTEALLIYLAIAPIFFGFSSSSSKNLLDSAVLSVNSVLMAFFLSFLSFKPYFLAQDLNFFNFLEAPKAFAMSSRRFNKTRAFGVNSLSFKKVLN